MDTKQQATPARPKKTTYKVSNWAEYDQALQQRGSLTVWISEEAFAEWEYHGPRQRGGQKRYSELAIETSLTFRGLYHLPFRQTEGFMRSLLGLLGSELDVPDHTTLSRRQGPLSVQIAVRPAQEAVHVVVDSTGLKVYGEGEWKVRQHGVSKRRTWRKLHLAVDEATGEIVAETLTENAVDDADQVPPLLDAVETPISAFGGDGAYDKKKVYEALQARAHAQGEPITISIPPRKDAKIWQHGNCQAPPHPRDVNLRYIRQHGRKKWKRDSRYHRRSLSETAMFRYKRILGSHLASRTLTNQKTEARIGCKILNHMTHLGMPNSYKVAA